MKKYILIISTLALLVAGNSCSERDLDLFPPSSDEIANVNTVEKLQQLLNGGYLSISSTNIFGTRTMVLGDIMGDKMFTNVNPSFLNSYNFNFNSTQQGDFSAMYDGLYGVIANCNLVINNTIVPDSDKLTRIKGEARILRGLAYFTLVNYYSASPTSGLNPEYGVPLVLENYDSTLQPARATIAQVYDQIIEDLNAGMMSTELYTSTKTTFSQNAAKLLLSKVYLTRRAAGDAQLALQLATEVRDFGAGDNDTFQTSSPISPVRYNEYFAAREDGVSEEQAETIWELDLNVNSNKVNGIGANISLPGYYFRLDPKKAFLFNQTFYSSFATTDVRRGSNPVTPTSLLTSSGVPNNTFDSPPGYWTNKYPQISSEGRYYRNIKILRYSEAYLNRIEALLLAGQNAQALTELNEFATSRSGNTYTGTNLLEDILAERSKEFYGEGQRFLDLKRYNQPLARPSNCTVCDLAPTDKLFVLPVSQAALNSNMNLKQYPGYN